MAFLILSYFFVQVGTDVRLSSGDQAPSVGRPHTRWTSDLVKVTRN